MEDPYIVLNIPSNKKNNKKFIKETFNILMKSFHSDKGGNADLHKKLIQAYTIVSSPFKKYILDNYGLQFLSKAEFKESMIEFLEKIIIEIENKEKDLMKNHNSKVSEDNITSVSLIISQKEVEQLKQINEIKFLIKLLFDMLIYQLDSISIVNNTMYTENPVNSSQCKYSIIHNSKHENNPNHPNSTDLNCSTKMTLFYMLKQNKNKSFTINQLYIMIQNKFILYQNDNNTKNFSLSISNKVNTQSIKKFTYKVDLNYSNTSFIPFTEQTLTNNFSLGFNNNELTKIDTYASKNKLSLFDYNIDSLFERKILLVDEEDKIAINGESLNNDHKNKETLVYDDENNKFIYNNSDEMDRKENSKKNVGVLSKYKNQMNYLFNNYSKEYSINNDDNNENEFSHRLLFSDIIKNFIYYSHSITLPLKKLSVSCNFSISYKEKESHSEIRNDVNVNNKTNKTNDNSGKRYFYFPLSIKPTQISVFKNLDKQKSLSTNISKSLLSLNDFTVLVTKTLSRLNSSKKDIIQAEYSHQDKAKSLTLSLINKYYYNSRKHLSYSCYSNQRKNETKTITNTIELSTISKYIWISDVRWNVSNKLNFGFKTNLITNKDGYESYIYFTISKGIFSLDLPLFISYNNISSVYFCGIGMLLINKFNIIPSFLSYLNKGTKSVFTCVKQLFTSIFSNKYDDSNSNSDVNNETTMNDIKRKYDNANLNKYDLLSLLELNLYYNFLYREINNVHEDDKTIKEKIIDELIEYCFIGNKDKITSLYKTLTKIKDVSSTHDLIFNKQITSKLKLDQLKDTVKNLLLDRTSSVNNDYLSNLEYLDDLVLDVLIAIRKFLSSNFVNFIDSRSTENNNSDYLINSIINEINITTVIRDFFSSLPENILDIEGVNNIVLEDKEELFLLIKFSKKVDSDGNSNNNLFVIQNIKFKEQLNKNSSEEEKQKIDLKENIKKEDKENNDENKDNKDGKDGKKEKCDKSKKENDINDEEYIESSDESN